MIRRCADPPIRHGNVGMCQLVLAIECERSVVSSMAVVLPLLPHQLVHQFAGTERLVTVRRESDPSSFESS
jgi:hypothetical protein